MASIYMRIDGVQVTGGATIEGIPGEGWFALNSYSWGAVRSVAMDIGNGTNADSGMVAMSEVNLTKEVDGASEDLLSFLFSPGPEGKDVEVVFTKPSTSGEGADIYFQVKLQKARLVSYNVSGSDGSQPFESIALSYIQLDQKHWHEGNGGKLEQGGLVSYNVPQGKLLSGAK
ncbi:type VI secretion system tube protein Hcp [Vibrio sp. Of7-15]|uniref:Hcp family type VI secretion system effector n=1 Tax=Vibrio sp. Of7-15 TaxID=2724879 RepID=UPI001EF28DDD|nr:type VI secretion system tube protein Hcp [Vibrio sp. Of7-15]MCG7496185.1 type VI secretion system tube protein Hcp [Vibrio sp. Of7-15]